MQITSKNLSPTKVQLTLEADADQLAAVKQTTLQAVAKDMKLPGFRQGKAPLSLVEKQANPSTLQTEFLDRAMNVLYGAALDEKQLRPVAQPEVKITKFVPFDTLAIEVTVEVIGDVKLADYKKIRLAKKAVSVAAKDVDEVIEQLRDRESERKEVTRAAKDGDQVTIDFSGVDAESKVPIAGGDGKDYPLVLGSNTFIPGFEPEVVGLKAGDTKTFTVTFPKDYGAKELQEKKVEFTITVHKVEEVVKPKVDDAFAAKAGPFKTVAELKADVKKQLVSEKEYNNDRDYVDELITKIASESAIAVPESLIEEQVEKLLADQRQSVVYRGMTWQEYLDNEKLTEEQYREKIRPDAELRVKVGLVLSEVANREDVSVTEEELEARMQLLRAQYTDKAMQDELAKPETRRDIASRLLSEKTANKLVSYATAA